MQPIFFGPRSALQANLSKKKNQVLVSLLSYSWDLGPTGSDPGPLHRTQWMHIQPNLSLPTPQSDSSFGPRNVKIIHSQPL